MNDNTDSTTQATGSQVAFTPEEIAFAQVALVEIAQQRRKRIAKLVREIGNIDAALQYSLLDQDAAQQIAVRCPDCGTVFLKYRDIVDPASAFCTNPDCARPVWLVPAIEDKQPVAFPPEQADPSTADETVPTQDVSIGGSYGDEALQAAGF